MESTTVKTRRVHVRDTKLLSEQQRIMKRAFGPDTLDSLKVTGKALKASQKSPKADQLILLVCVEDTHRKVVAALSASLLALVKGDLLVINNIACDEAYQGKGLSKALYTALQQSINTLAAQRQRELRLIMGETDPTVEGMVVKSAFPRRRLYIRKDPNHYIELPYYQISMDCDEEGHSAHAPKALHLMAACPEKENEEEMPAEVVLDGIRTMYQYNIPDTIAKRSTGYERMEAQIEQEMERIREAIGSTDTLHRFTPEQREDLRARGVTIIDHDPANASTASSAPTIRVDTPTAGAPSK